MGSKNPIPTVTEWLKFPWEKEEHNEMTQQDRDGLQAEMDAMNAALAQKQQE